MPAAIVRVAALGWGPGLTGLFGSAAPLARRRLDRGRADARGRTAAFPFDDSARFAGLPLGAAGLLLAAALLGGINETGFAGVAPLLSIASGGRQPLFAAAAVGFGSFLAQYGLGAAADRWGGCKVLMGCSALLSLALATIALAPSALPAAAVVIGGSGGGLYTVAVVFGLQARRSTGLSAALIGAAALAYTAGSLAAPSAVGLGIELVGAPVTIGLLGALPAAMFGAIVASRGWRWVDRDRARGTTCAFHFSPRAAVRRGSRHAFGTGKRGPDQSMRRLLQACPSGTT